MTARYSLLLLFYLTTHAAAASTDPTDREQRFVKGLVQRRLFSLAEQACRNQLVAKELDERACAQWTVELIRITGQHAANAPAPRQTALWAAAHEQADHYLARNGASPFALLVQVQDALSYLAQGELARLEAEVAVDPQQAYERARGTIRRAATELESLDQRLTERMAAAHGSVQSSIDLTPDELFSLQNNVRYQRARSLQNQALCYDIGSPDRVASLSAAVKQLNATLTQLRADDSLTGQVYLDLATCYRLLSEQQQAERALTIPLAETSSTPIRLKAMAEQARLTIAAGHPQRAFDDLNQLRNTLKEPAAVIDFARIEAMLTVWKAALARKDEALARQWQKQTSEAVGKMGQEHGQYWGRRARLEQLSVAQTEKGSSSVDIIVSTADEFYRKEQFDEAIATYEKAAELAQTTGDLASGADAEYKAALIEQKLRRYGVASLRLQRLALDRPEHEASPTRHLLAAWNTAQAARTDPDAIGRYRSLLQEHAITWPSSPTSNTARKWLGDLLLSQKEWQAAAAAFRGIAPDSEVFPVAIKSLANCYDRWLHEQRQRDGDVNTIRQEATDFFDQLILGTDRQWPERWSPVQRTAALTAARLRLYFADDQALDAQYILQAALNDRDADDKSWTEEAKTLLVLALAGQTGRQQEALTMLQTMAAETPDQLLQLVTGLSALTDQASPALRMQLSRIQIAALKQLRPHIDQLAAAQRLELERIEAEGLLQAGEAEEALANYRKLAERLPDNQAVQVRLAELLLESDDPQTRDEAINRWQNIAKRTRATDRDAWLKARYYIAVALFQRNRPADGKHPSDRELAAQRLRYVMATADLGDSSWKAKITDLLQQCQNSQRD